MRGDGRGPDAKKRSPGRFTMIPNCVLDGTVPGLTPTLIAVYAAFRRYAFDGRSAYPGNETIARNLRPDKPLDEKTIRRSLEDLQQLGLIRRPEKRRGRRGPAIIEFLDRAPMSTQESLERTSGASRVDIHG